MKHNFSVIYKYSILNKINTTSFKVLTGIFLLVSIAISLVPAFIDSRDEQTIVGVISEEAGSFTLFEAIGSELYAEVAFEKTTKTEGFEEDFEFVIDIDNFKIYSYDASLSMGDEGMIDILFSQYNTFAVAEGLELTNEDLNRLLTTPETEFVNLGDKQGSTGMGSFTWIFNYGYTIIGMMVLMISSQFLGQEIMEEKTTRAMEVIITSVSSGTHMLAKILSNMTYIFILISEGIVFSIIGSKITALIFPDSGIQTLKLVTDGIKGMISESDMSINIYFIIFTFIILFVLTIITLLTFVSSIASSVTTVEEFQNSVSIATSLVIVCYMVSLFVTSIDVRIILSYIPIMNFFMIPGLLLAGNIGMVSVGISLLISLVFFILTYVVSIRVYRVGVLNYSAKGVIKVFKQAFGLKIK